MHTALADWVKASPRLWSVGVLVGLAAVALAGAPRADASTQLGPPFDPDGPTYTDKDCGNYHSQYPHGDGDCDAVPETAAASMPSEAFAAMGTASSEINFMSPGYGLLPGPPYQWMRNTIDVGAVSYHLDRPAWKLNFTVTLHAKGSATRRKGMVRSVEGYYGGMVQSQLDTTQSIWATVDARVRHTSCPMCLGGNNALLGNLMSVKDGKTVTEPGRDITLRFWMTNCIRDGLGGCDPAPVPPGEIIISGGAHTGYANYGSPDTSSVRVETAVTGVYLDSIEY